jgi:hypothetical protein
MVSPMPDLVELLEEGGKFSPCHWLDTIDQS